MNCEEVQKYLSDFLDKNLDVEHGAAIRDHLAICSLCSEEMASLAECQRLVSGLPVVEPPVGFTNRVMAEVRETANPPRLWERLFLPLRIKIPLQATAVVLIAVLAAYIYQKEPLQRESVVAVQPESSSKKQEETHNLAPSVAQAPTAPSKTKQVVEETKARVQEFKDSAQLKELQSPSKTGRTEQRHCRQSARGCRAVARSQDQIRSPATLSPCPTPRKIVSSERGCLPSPGTIFTSRRSAGERRLSAGSTTRKGKCFKRRRGSRKAIVASGSTRKKRYLLSQRSEIRCCGWGRTSLWSRVGNPSEGTGSAMTKPQRIDWHQRRWLNDDR